MTAINRLIMHHTGGTYTPNAVDLRAYHGVTDGDGQRHAGRFPVSANAAGAPLRAGTYAAHCLGLNSGSIGEAMACMGGGVWANPRSSRFFPRPAQVDGFLRTVADQCARFGIVVDRRTCLTHAEVQITLGVIQRNKWDYDYDPRGRNVSRDPIAIGDELRAEIRLLMAGSPVPQPKPPQVVRPTLRRGDRGPDVIEAQRRLGVAPDGAFGPATFAAVVALQRRRQMLPDGVIGPMTWAALQVSP